MIRWLFNRALVKGMAQVVHEMCSFALHLRDLGRPPHNYFLIHPMLIEHRDPDANSKDQVHIFYLSDGRFAFRVMVPHSEPGGNAWVMVSPDKDFQGVNIQATEVNRYIVWLDRFAACPRGPLASNLLRRFVRDYAAADVST